MPGVTAREPSRQPPILRFAPSPTGRLHLGHALSALLNVDMARALSGQLLVRIEDTDTQRCRPEHTTAILEDLEWLGVRSAGPILRQSEHLPVYAGAAGRLAAMGLLYPCFATRQQIVEAAAPGAVDPDGAPLYAKLQLRLPDAEVAERMSAGQPFAMRLDMAAAIARAATISGGAGITYTELDGDLVPTQVAIDPARWGDVVIQRKGHPASYHLAVVVDDARQGITHVVRGADLVAATDVHRLLQVLLGLPEPLYRHHRLIVDENGRKLAKRAGDTSLASLRERGVTPAGIRRLVGIGETVQC